jgi:hypothetical protein
VTGWAQAALDCHDCFSIVVIVQIQRLVVGRHLMGGAGLRTGNAA